VTRPGLLAVVTGTATDVGKTWWTAALARALLANGSTVAARKPVQSCEPGAPTDAQFLAEATTEPIDHVCPPHRLYRLAWAPPMAAAELGAPPFTIADLVSELRWPERVDIGLVEGAGGPRSPLAVDGDNVSLVGALAPDVTVLVADAGLGTLNAVRLSADALATTGTPLVVALNHFSDDALHARNRAVLEADGLRVVTSPVELAHSLARWFA